MTDKERCNGESTHKCLQCKKSFGGTKTHNEPHLKCTQCKYETNTKAKLRQHISTHIQEKKFNCNQCNKLFGTRSSLITHLITHGENINNKKKTIKTHMFSDSIKSEKQCNECDYTTKYQHRLKNHIRIYHDGVRFECNQCDKVYKIAKQLQKHETSDHERNLIQCEKCKFKPCSQEKMEKHTKEQHGMNNICVLCKKEYSSSLSLFDHWKNIHSKAKVVCQKCDFETNSAARLGRHVNRYHTINKCDKCDHISATLNCLKIHQSNKHEGKRFKCDQCDYKATQKGNLSIHRQSMHDGIIYNCDFCDYKSSTTRSMLWHKKAKHTNYISSKVTNC